MKLLVSTPLQIFLVDPFNEEISVLRAGDGYYYGITFKDGTLVLTHSGGYLQFFCKGKNTIRTPNHLIQPHQIEWVSDRALVANTGRNCISAYDIKGNFCGDFYLNEIKWDDKDAGRKGNHFNSVHLSGKSIFVVAHNYDRPSEVWELNWPELRVMNVYNTKAAWAHNYWECEWGKIICDSKNGSLYDISTEETIWQAEEQPAMTRGLAATSEYIFVGCSSFNERNNRYWKTGGIWVINRKTLRTANKILMPGSGDVHDIRIVGTEDACHHNQMLTFETLRNIQKISPTVGLAYRLRKKYPRFRNELFPVSQVVRTAQMSARWWNAIFI